MKGNHLWLFTINNNTIRGWAAILRAVDETYIVLLVSTRLTARLDAADDGLGAEPGQEHLMMNNMTC
jgi:hypothetical protein